MSERAAASGVPRYGAETQRLLDALPGPTVVLDGAGRIAVANAAWRQLCRAAGSASPDAFVSEDYVQACAAIMRPAGPVWRSCREGVEAVLRGARDAFQVDLEVSVGGADRWYSLTATPLGEAAVVVAHLDVTDSKEAERQISTLLESPIDGLMVTDAGGTIEMVNAQLEAMFGYRRGELLGRNMVTLVPQRFRRRHQRHQAGFFEAPHARPMGTGLELYGLRRDGSEFPVEISLTPMETGSALLVAAAIRDLSKLQEAERALKESRRRMALHIEGTPLAVIEWEVGSGLIAAWNPAAERIFGYTAEEVVGRQRADIILPAGLGAEAEAEAGSSLQVDRFLGIVRNLGKGGETVVCQWYNAPLEDERGVVVGVAALGLDITARQRALEALLNAQEEERGRISRDLHDQVGQSLTALLLGITRSAEGSDPGALEELRELTTSTLDEVRRISRDLRPALLDELGLNAAISRFARELASRRELAVDVLVRTPASLERNTQIVIYRVVQEALTNIVRHAEADHASVVATVVQGKLQIVVEDDGRGFDPSALAAGESAGIAGMRERLELLGGSLQIDSTPGRGTIITGRLPVVAEAGS